MKIETKLQPGDTAWLTHNNRTTETEVLEVKTFSELDGPFQALVTHVSYVVTVAGKPEEYGQDRVFATKQELLESL